jgi:large subunit ribosomal protein L7/L12
VDLILTQNPQGKNQIEVIKKLREVTDLDLTKAKWVTENLPAVILQNLKAEEGERIKAALEKAGAAVSIKPT